MLNPGDTYGEWTVLEEAAKRGRHRYFKCRCSCGVEREVKGSNIKLGISRACGHATQKNHNRAMDIILSR